MASGKQPQCSRKQAVLHLSRAIRYNEGGNENLRTTLLQQPVTKEEFERELLTLPLGEAESRREFWTLCEALQAMENTRCPPPEWFLASFQQALEQPSGERAAPWRELRHRLLEHLGKWQKEPRALRPHRYQSFKNG
jgi:hypothetical protein